MTAKKYPLSIVIGAVDRASGPVARAATRIDRALLRVAAPAIRMHRALGKFSRAAGLDRVGMSLKNVAGRSKEFGSALGGALRKVTLLTAAAVAGTAALVHGMADAGNHAAKLSKKVGVGVEWLQEWQYVSKISGIEQERFAIGLKYLSRNIGDAAAGVGRAVPAFNSLGIQLKNADGTSRELSKVYEETVAKLRGLEDANLRNALAMRIFGEAGMDLGPLLVTSGEEIQRLRDRAQELGIVISEDVATASEEYLDTLDNLKGAASGARNAFLGPALPQITAQLQRLTGWIAGNREKIAEWGQWLAARIPTALDKTKQGLKNLWAATKPVRDAVGWLTDRFGAANVAAVALGAVLLGPTIAAAASLSVSLLGLGGSLLRVGAIMLTTQIGSFSLAGGLKWLGSTIFTKVLPALARMAIALLANPLTWIVIGVTAAVAALIYFRKEIWALLQVVGGAVVDAMKWIGGWLIWPFEKAWDFIKGFVNWIPEAISGAVDWVVSKVKWLTSWLPDWLTGGGGDRELSVKLDDREIARSGGAGGAPQTGKVEVNVNFDKVPRGVRTDVQASAEVPLNFTQGFANTTPG